MECSATLDRQQMLVKRLGRGIRGRSQLLTVVRLRVGQA